MLTFLVLSFTIFALFDSIDKINFSVKDVYVDTMGILMTTAFTAYFAGRSYEKVQIKRK
jgi:hypothetical protein